MNKILPERWSREWYELTTTEELLEILREAKTANHHLAKVQEIWRERIAYLEKELKRRTDEDQD